MKTAVKVLFEHKKQKRQRPENDCEGTENSARPGKFLFLILAVAGFCHLASKAKRKIFDIGGRMIQNIRLSHTQEIGQVEISAGELLPGTYTYSLIVSGKVIDSKRMVVTE